MTLRAKRLFCHAMTDGVARIWLGGGQATLGFVKERRFRDLMCQSPTGGFLIRSLGEAEVSGQPTVQIGRFYSLWEDS